MNKSTPSAKSKLVLCHAYKLGLTEGQEVVGAKRGGESVLEYTLTTSAKAHGLLAPAQRGWRPTPHLRRRRGSKGLRTQFSPRLLASGAFAVNQP